MAKMLAGQKSASGRASVADDLDLVKPDAAMSSSDEDGPILRHKGQLDHQEMKTNGRGQLMDEINEKVSAALDLMLRNKLEAHLLDCSLARFVSKSFQLLACGHYNTGIAVPEAEAA